MAVDPPTNCWTAAEARIAVAIAHSAAFQAMTGTATATDAGAWIFGEALDRPLDGRSYSRDEMEEHHRHYAQVYSDPQTPYGKRRHETPTYVPYGTVVVFFERLITELEEDLSEVPLEIERRWKNWLGDLVDQIHDWIDQEGGPIITATEVAQVGTNPREEWPTDGIWQGAEILVSWGRP